MRFRIVSILALLTMACFAQQPAVPPPQPDRPIYTNLVTQVAPEVRQGRVFVPLRVISEQFDAIVRWLPETRTVEISRESEPVINLVIGSTTAHVDSRAVLLDAAPFIFQGRTLVPLRFVAETYNVPVGYNAPTHSVRLLWSGRLYILPLQDTRTGVVIDDPQDGELVSNPIRVQGQANVFEGNLIVEVRDARGTVLGHTVTTAGMGGFYAFSTQLYYNQPGVDAIDGSIVVFSRDGKGDNTILAQDSVKVILASTR